MNNTKEVLKKVADSLSVDMEREDNGFKNCTVGEVKITAKGTVAHIGTSVSFNQRVDEIRKRSEGDIVEAYRLGMKVATTLLKSVIQAPLDFEVYEDEEGAEI